jgi:hypothetical protein
MTRAASGTKKMSKAPCPPPPPVCDAPEFGTGALGGNGGNGRGAFGAAGRCDRPLDPELCPDEWTVDRAIVRAELELDAADAVALVRSSTRRNALRLTVERDARVTAFGFDFCADCSRSCWTTGPMFSGEPAPSASAIGGIGSVVTSSSMGPAPTAVGGSAVDADGAVGVGAADGSSTSVTWETTAADSAIAASTSAFAYSVIPAARSGGCGGPAACAEAILGPAPRTIAAANAAKKRTALAPPVIGAERVASSARPNQASRPTAPSASGHRNSSRGRFPLEVADGLRPPSGRASLQHGRELHRARRRSSPVPGALGGAPPGWRTPPSRPTPDPNLQRRRCWARRRRCGRRRPRPMGD